MRWIPLLPILALLAATATPAGDNPQSTPEARVRVFIADYFRVHGQSTRIFDAGDFDAWRRVIDGLDQSHFVAGAHSGLDGVMSSIPEHHPGTERIIRSTPDDGGVLIETQGPDAPVTHYYEYELRPVGDDWRIASLHTYVESADAPWMTPADRERFQNPKVQALRAPLKAAPDASAIFAGNAAVRRIGMLNVGTGILVVGDLAYGPLTLAPLSARIEPGRYPVEVAIARQHVAALRMLISDRPVVKWYPAVMGGGGHSVDVESGEICISDVSALLDIKRRHMEKQLEKFAQAAAPTEATMLTLVNPDDGVVATSGYGDGSYPVYWGVDRSGEAAVLLVDLAPG